MQAPTFTLPNAQGEPISLEDYRGKKSYSISIRRIQRLVVRPRHVISVMRRKRSKKITPSFSVFLLIVRNGIKTLSQNTNYRSNCYQISSMKCVSNMASGN